MDYVSVSTLYQCDLCLASVNDKDAIKKHMSKYHGSQILELKRFKERNMR